MTLAQRIEALLRARPRSISDLAAELKMPAQRIADAMKPLRPRLWNAGTDDAPRWFWIVGDDADAATFAAAVEALVRERPVSTGELCAATGTAGSKRVWHALVKLRDKPGTRLVRIGDPKRPTWFWLPETASIARLTRPPVRP